MDKTTLRIGCKINLYLEITGVREDGYHELETLFYPVPEPHDVLTLTPARQADGLALTCSDSSLAAKDNLVSKAYEAFAAKTGWRPGLLANLTKAIPSGAGLGGGSADAAALLGYLNANASERALSADALVAVAGRLGADVPFFLGGGPAWATGIGDVLSPAAKSLAGFSVLVAVPQERVATAWAYAEWDKMEQMRLAGNSSLTRGLTAATEPFCVSGMMVANCFEAVVFPKYPTVRTLKERMLVLGASAAAMSGSGSAVFGLFRGRAQAEEAYESLAAEGFGLFLSGL